MAGNGVETSPLNLATRNAQLPRDYWEVGGMR